MLLKTIAHTVVDNGQLDMHYLSQKYVWLLFDAGPEGNSYLREK